MSRGRGPSTIAEMPDPDRQQACGHGYPPGDCPVCGTSERGDGEPLQAIFDPQVWVAAYAASSREPPDLPVELVGVPLS
jgi:hypothetical protein